MKAPAIEAPWIHLRAPSSYINVNRNIIDPKTKRWWESPNYPGHRAVPRRRGDACDAGHGPDGPNVRIDGRYKIISCPGRERTNAGRAGFPADYKEAGPKDIRLGLLQVEDIMIGAASAEVFNPIAQRLKKESPYTRTMLVTLTNGSARSGYIPHDAGFGMYTFEVLSSRLQRGCAETVRGRDR